MDVTDAAQPADEEQPADLDRLGAVLTAVERALGRLDDGSYGRCEVCTDPIDDAQLVDDPTVTVCPAHLDVITAP